MRLGIKAASAAAIITMSMASSASAVVMTGITCGSSENTYTITLSNDGACSGFGVNALPFAAELMKFQEQRSPDIQFLGWAKREPGSGEGVPQLGAPDGAVLGPDAADVNLQLFFVDPMNPQGSWVFDTDPMWDVSNVFLGIRLGVQGDPEKEGFSDETSDPDRIGSPGDPDAVPPIPAVPGELWWATFWLDDIQEGGFWEVEQFGDAGGRPFPLPEEMYVWGTATMIPVPPAMLLLASAMGGLVLMRRRKSAA